MALPALGVQANTFIQPDDKFWSLYLKDAHAYDKIRMERWKGDADAILIFTGLFAATVATFAVSSYASLSPDTGSQTVVLLAQILASVNSSLPVIPVPDNVSPNYASPFQAPLTAIWINALWFLSLTTTLVCALLATLVQQWTRRYGHAAHRQGPPRLRGPVHIYLSQGLEKFGMEHMVVATVFLLHVSVAMFFVGLLVYLFSANTAVAWAAASGMIGVVLIYVLLSITGFLYAQSPYQTPLTPVLRLCMEAIIVLVACLMTLYDVFPPNRRRMLLPRYNRWLKTRYITHLRFIDSIVNVVKSIARVGTFGFRYLGRPTIAFLSRYALWHGRVSARLCSTPVLNLLSANWQDVAEMTIDTEGGVRTRAVGQQAQIKRLPIDIRPSGVIVCEALAPVLDQVKDNAEHKARLQLIHSVTIKATILQHATSLLRSCSLPSGLDLEEVTFNQRLIASLSLFRTVTGSLLLGAETFGEQYFFDVAATFPRVECGLIDWPVMEAISLLSKRRSSSSTTFLIYCFAVANCVESYELAMGTALSSAIWQHASWRYIMLSLPRRVSNSNLSAMAPFAERAVKFTEIPEDTRQPECTREKPVCHVCQLALLIEAILDICQSNEVRHLDDYAATWTGILVDVSKATERRLFDRDTAQFTSRHPGFMRNRASARRIGYTPSQVLRARKPSRGSISNTYKGVLASYPCILEAINTLLEYQRLFTIHEKENPRAAMGSRRTAYLIDLGYDTPKLGHDALGDQSSTPISGDRSPVPTRRSPDSHSTHEKPQDALGIQSTAGSGEAQFTSPDALKTRPHSWSSWRAPSEHFDWFRTPSPSAHSLEDYGIDGKSEDDSTMAGSIDPLDKFTAFFEVVDGGSEQSWTTWHPQASDMVQIPAYGVRAGIWPHVSADEEHVRRVDYEEGVGHVLDGLVHDTLVHRERFRIGLDQVRRAIYMLGTLHEADESEGADGTEDQSGGDVSDGSLGRFSYTSQEMVAVRARSV